MYSKYINTLIRDYKRLNYKSFLDKHGVKAVTLAKKMSERQKNEQTKDNWSSYRFNQVMRYRFNQVMRYN